MNLNTFVQTIDSSSCIATSQNGYDIWMISTFALIAVLILATLIIFTLAGTLLFFIKRWFVLSKETHELRVQMRKLRETKDELEESLQTTQEAKDEIESRLKRLERSRSGE